MKRKPHAPILPPRPPRRKDRDERFRRDGWFPPVPSRVEDLRGMKFGRLLVRAFAGMGAGGRSYWCCECDCGSLCRVPRSRLLGNTAGARGKNQQISCGCYRADPAVRRAARRKVDAARRADICTLARNTRKRGSIPYSMTAEGAASELGCGVADVEKLAQDGDLRSIMRGSALYLSAEDVHRWRKVQRRNSRHCRALDEAWLHAQQSK